MQFAGAVMENGLREVGTMAGRNPTGVASWAGVPPKALAATIATSIDRDGLTCSSLGRGSSRERGGVRPPRAK